MAFSWQSWPTKSLLILHIIHYLNVTFKFARPVAQHCIVVHLNQFVAYLTGFTVPSEAHGCSQSRTRSLQAFLSAVDRLERRWDN